MFDGNLMEDRGDLMVSVFETNLCLHDFFIEFINFLFVLVDFGALDELGFADVGLLKIGRKLGVEQAF